MRLTIVAGLIMGLSLAVQSMLSAHARAKVGPAAEKSGVRVHEVAPWYIANDLVPRSAHFAELQIDVRQPDSIAALPTGPLGARS
jgi:hypothetical protein